MEFDEYKRLTLASVENKLPVRVPLDEMELATDIVLYEGIMINRQIMQDQGEASNIRISAINSTAKIAKLIVDRKKISANDKVIIDIPGIEED